MHERHTIELRGEGAARALRVVAVADTHARPHPDARAHVAALAPHLILHAGDIGDLSVLDGLASIAPVLAVRGNIDPRTARTPDALTLSVTDAGALVARVLMVHIAVYGPKIRADAARLARAEQATIIVCGHSHVPFLGVDRGLTVFNPGSIGPRRFHLPIVFGVIDVARDRIDMRHVDCETGAVWSPP